MPAMLARSRGTASLEACPSWPHQGRVRRGPTHDETRGSGVGCRHTTEWGLTVCVLTGRPYGRRRERVNGALIPLHSDGRPRGSTGKSRGDLATVTLCGTGRRKDRGPRVAARDRFNRDLTSSVALVGGRPRGARAGRRWGSRAARRTPRPPRARRLTCTPGAPQNRAGRS